eukprot:993052-Prymnesium_polylepis.1
MGSSPRSPPSPQTSPKLSSRALAEPKKSLSPDSLRRPSTDLTSYRRRSSRTVAPAEDGKEERRNSNSNPAGTGEDMSELEELAPPPPTFRMRVKATLKGIDDTVGRGAFLSFKERKYIFSHSSELISAWDWLLCIFVVYTAIFIPMVLVFPDDIGFEGEEAFGILLDVLFMIDIVMKFRTSYPDHGYNITNIKKIQRNYLYGASPRPPSHTTRLPHAPAAVPSTTRRCHTQRVCEHEEAHPPTLHTQAGSRWT